LLRGVDRFLDLSEPREHLVRFYSHTGRPSIDPELMIRMLVVGYWFGIHSEHRLCDEGHLNLAYRWFCRLDLQQRVPDHSTFSKNRHGRFRQSAAFRHVFESVLRLCTKEGLLAGEGFAIDASVIKADASRATRWMEGEEPTRAGPAQLLDRLHLALPDQHRRRLPQRNSTPRSPPPPYGGDLWRACPVKSTT